jgi:hypothetical protein
MAQARALPAQDGHLMSQGDEFEFQVEATTNPEREQGTEGGQKREHADDGMAVAQKRPLPGLLEFRAGTPPNLKDHTSGEHPDDSPMGRKMAALNPSRVDRSSLGR